MTWGDGKGLVASGKWHVASVVCLSLQKASADQKSEYSTSWQRRQSTIIGDKFWAWPTWGNMLRLRLRLRLKLKLRWYEECCHRQQHDHLSLSLSQLMIVITCGNNTLCRLSMCNMATKWRLLRMLSFIEWRQIDLQRFNCRTNWAKRQLHYTSTGWSVARPLGVRNVPRNVANC